MENFNVLPIVRPETPEAKQESDQSAITFDDFWSLYPRKNAKLDARKAWSKIDSTSYVAIISAVLDWARVWEEKDNEYVPLPGSYLRGERWEDELPPRFRNNVRHNSHSPASLPERSPRTPIPEHVHLALTKIREGKKL